METSTTMKFVGPVNSKIIKKLFPIFLFFKILLLPAYIFHYSAIPTILNGIITFITDGIIFILIIEALKKIYKNEEYLRPRFSNIKTTLQKILRIFISGIFPCIFILLGLVCFIVPGFIFAKRYMYVPLISEEESIGPLNAMKKSKFISKNQSWEIFSYIFWLSIGYGIIGIVIVTIGLFIGTFVSGFLFSALSISIKPDGIISWIVSIFLGWVSTVHITSLLIKGYIEGKLSLTKNSIIL